jgi:antitoxin (DNA-binding transcriptional repressor) of toxin-antitoxin stability system
MVAMVTTIEANSPELLALVERTRRGGEVVLTIDGKPEARVTVAESQAAKNRPGKAVDMAAWARELEEHLYDGVIGNSGPDTQTILDELREERI